ncbi:hypothetical protein DFH09DRAFT_1364192 [Mycena vulgaris]|nr:hypothetical protein DFH09DRAFT_1364192 [Mycena vulgaris]
MHGAGAGGIAGGRKRAPCTTATGVRYAMFSYTTEGAVVELEGIRRQAPVSSLRHALTGAYHGRERLGCGAREDATSSEAKRATCFILAQKTPPTRRGAETRGWRDRGERRRRRRLASKAHRFLSSASIYTRAADTLFLQTCIFCVRHSTPPLKLDDGGACSSFLKGVLSADGTRELLGWMWRCGELEGLDQGWEQPEEGGTARETVEGWHGECEQGGTLAHRRANMTVDRPRGLQRDLLGSTICALDATYSRREWEERDSGEGIAGEEGEEGGDAKARARRMRARRTEMHTHVSEERAVHASWERAVHAPLPCPENRALAEDGCNERREESKLSLKEGGWSRSTSSRCATPCPAHPHTRADAGFLQQCTSTGLQRAHRHASLTAHVVGRALGCWDGGGGEEALRLASLRMLDLEGLGARGTGTCGGARRRRRAFWLHSGLLALESEAVLVLELSQHASSFLQSVRRHPSRSAHIVGAPRDLGVVGWRDEEAREAPSRVRVLDLEALGVAAHRVHGDTAQPERALGASRIIWNEGRMISWDRGARSRTLEGEDSEKRASRERGVHVSLELLLLGLRGAVEGEWSWNGVYVHALLVDPGTRTGSSRGALCARLLYADRSLRMRELMKLRRTVLGARRRAGAVLEGVKREDACSRSEGSTGAELGARSSWVEKRGARGREARGVATERTKLEALEGAVLEERGALSLLAHGAAGAGLGA